MKTNCFHFIVNSNMVHNSMVDNNNYLYSMVVDNIRDYNYEKMVPLIPL